MVPVVDGGAVAVFGGRGPESREQEASGLAWGVGAGAGGGLVELRARILSKWERQRLPLNAARGVALAVKPCRVEVDY